MMEVKNNAQGSMDEVLIEEGFYVLKFQNDEDEVAYPTLVKSTNVLSNFTFV